jgi:hypothetical protein
VLRAEDGRAVRSQERRRAWRELGWVDPQRGSLGKDGFAIRRRGKSLMCQLAGCLFNRSLG